MTEYISPIVYMWRVHEHVLVVFSFTANLSQVALEMKANISIQARARMESKPPHLTKMVAGLGRIS